MMIPNAKSPTRVGLHTCEDLLEKLRWEAKRLENGWSAYDSFNFVITGHHLFEDWVNKCGSEKSQSNKCNLPEAGRLIFQVIADLCNGSKHWQNTRKKTLERQVVTRVSDPEIGDWYAFCEGGEMIYIDLDDYSLSMAELTDQVLGWFQWIFEGPSAELRQKLTDELQSIKTQYGHK